MACSHRDSYDNNNINNNNINNNTLISYITDYKAATGS